MPTTAPHLEKQFATPRLGPSDKSLSYNVTSQPTVFSVECAPTAEGFVEGKLHLTGAQLASMLGQSSVDYAHLTSIDFNKASTNIGTAMGGHFTLGSEEAGTESTFATLDRTMHVCRDSGVTACHLVVPPSCGSGAMSTFSDLGSMDTRHVAYGSAADTRSAIGRSLRWAGQDFTKDFSGQCLKVDAGSKARYLVPSDVEHRKCAMSTLFGANVNKAGFCNGRYADAKATFAVDPDGRKCRVVTEDDFATVSKALKSRFAESNPLQAGLTLTMKSFKPTDAELAEELTESGFTPRVTLSATFNRETTSEFLNKAVDDESEAVTSASLSRADMHKLIGEDYSAETSTATLGAGFTSEESFAEGIMNLKLEGEDTGTTASGMTESKLTVTAAKEESTDEEM